MRTLSGLNVDLLVHLVQKWLAWKMSEVDDIIQVQSKKNHSQEWTSQRKIFLEEKNGLSLLTGKRKTQVSQVELREQYRVLLRTDIDFANAFNSVSHGSLWTVLEGFRVTDVD